MHVFNRYYKQKSQMRINWIWLIMHESDILIPLLIKTFYIGCWVVWCEVDLGLSKHCHEDNMIVATITKIGFKNLWMIWPSNVSFLIILCWGFHWGYCHDCHNNQFPIVVLSQQKFIRQYPSLVWRRSALSFISSSFIALGFVLRITYTYYDKIQKSMIWRINSVSHFKAEIRLFLSKIFQIFLYILPA